MNPKNTQEQIVNFRTNVKSLVENPDFLKAIQYKLICWNNSHELYEVIGEAYSIGHQAILEGKSIPNPEAWLRTTIWNILRTENRRLSRDKKKKVSLNLPTKNSSETWSLEEVIPSDQDQSNLYFLAEEEEKFKNKNQQIKLILEEINFLPEEQRKIFTLKEMQNLTWEEIAQHLGNNVKLSTLRKRHSRVKESLRKNLEGRQVAQKSIKQGHPMK